MGLLKLLDVLRKLAASLGMSWESLMALLNILLGLLPLPNVADEAATKAWFEKLAKALADVAAKTATQLDDVLAKFLASVLASPEQWAMFYAAIKKFLVKTMEASASDVDGAEGAVRGAVMVEFGASPELRELARAAAIDPATVMLIVELVIKFWQMFRK